MHGVSKGERLAAIDLLKIILNTLKELFAGQPWPKLRLTYLKNDPTAIAYSSDHAYPRLLREAVKLIHELSPAEARDFFGVDMKSRWYMCPGSCNPEIHTDEFAASDYPRLAQLRPAKTAGAEELYCFVCGETVAIERTPCTDPECPADVIFTNEFGERVCLACDSSARSECRRRCLICPSRPVASSRIRFSNISVGKSAYAWRSRPYHALLGEPAAPASGRSGFLPL